MTKIKQESDGHYYEKIVTWKGEYDYKTVIFWMLTSIFSFGLFQIVALSKGDYSRLLMSIYSSIIFNTLMVLAGFIGKTRKVELKRIK